MLSFMYDIVRTLTYGSADLYLGGNSTGQGVLLWDGYNDSHFRAALYNYDQFSVYYNGYNGYDFADFGVVFSFHDPESLPEELPDGTWNCSVPYYHDFEQHLRCNFHQQCENGQDEVGCPYVNEACGPGQIYAGGKCYGYVFPWREVTWYEAFDDCLLRGARLASLSLPEEFTAVTSLLQQHVFDFVYVGLQSTPTHLPQFDASDEEFCVFAPCDPLTQLTCGSGQCVSLAEECDSMEQCLDGSDEQQCSDLRSFSDFRGVPPPAVVDFSNNGTFHVRPLDHTQFDRGFQCPETHFSCPGDSDFYCLPVYLRCNGVNDCPGGEDEAECDSYACPGLYRCRSSKVCLHPNHVCDGVNQCPENDDELLCGAGCPASCTCYGLAFYCDQSFAASDYDSLRFLEARGSGMTPGDVANNTMLIHLSLADCDLTHLDGLNLPNLRSLDLSDNALTEITGQDLSQLRNLQSLILSGNPLTSFRFRDSSFQASFPAMRMLDISRVTMLEFDVKAFMAFPSLQTLNMSDSGVERVFEMGFKPMTNLRVLDVRGCPMTEFPKGVFDGLKSLDAVYADNYKLCCSETLPPGFNPKNCRAPSDEISSCDALLRSDLYRVFLSVFASLALLGNLGSFVYRVFVNTGSNKLGFGVFVTHLCVADCFMGVYLAVIGVADRLEVSACLIGLITLDRFLVLRFPFSQLHFRSKSAHLACAAAWSLGLVLALVPLLPVTSHWEFYSQTGICIPLPITRKDFPGRIYSLAVMIILNFVLFLLIAAGQLFIFWSIRANSMSASDSTKTSKDHDIARRLITVAMSDFLCWFPIGLLGLLASNGVPIPGEVNVAMAIFVLPLNSALNPFLYTLNMLLERKRRAKEARMKKLFFSQQRSVTEEEDVVSAVYTGDEALRLFTQWLTEGLLPHERVASLLAEEGKTKDAHYKPVSE
nr:hypothetical protein BaRGS_008842 [Batillaria attramentaria]